MRWVWVAAVVGLAGCDGGGITPVDLTRVTIDQGFFGQMTAWEDGLAVPGPARVEVMESGMAGGSVLAESDGFYEIFKGPGTYTLCSAGQPPVCSDPVTVIEDVPVQCDFTATETGGSWACDTTVMLQ